MAGSSPQKRVTIATDQLVTVHSMSCSPELEIEDCEAETPPCLPSVRELAVRCQSFPRLGIFHTDKILTNKLASSKMRKLKADKLTS